jgi:hypothetical protein
MDAWTNDMPDRLAPYVHAKPIVPKRAEWSVLGWNKQPERVHAIVRVERADGAALSQWGCRKPAVSKRKSVLYSDCQPTDRQL